MQRYLARPGLAVPMPDRQGRLVPTEGEGTSVNELNPYYARLIADGDLVEAPPVAAAAPPAKSKNGAA